MRAPRLSLRAWLTLLFMAALLPMVAQLAVMAVGQRRAQRAQAEEQALQLARSLSAQHDDAITHMREALTAFARLPEVRSGELGACDALADGTLSQYGGYTVFGVVTLDGTQLCGFDGRRTPTAIADRAYFRQALTTPSFVVGEFAIGRLSGRPVLPAALAVIGDKGEVAGVAVTALDLEWLERTFDQVRLPDGATVTVSDRAGVVLARYPDAAGWVGRRMTSTPLITAMTARGEGTLQTIGLDNVRRLYGFTSFGGDGGAATIAVGLPAAHVFAPADRVWHHAITGTALVALFSVGLVWFGTGAAIGGRIRPLMRATRQIAGGKRFALGSLTGGHGEFAPLARAFDEMAITLGQREAELRAGEERYRAVVEGSIQGMAIIQDEIIRFANPSLAELLGFASVDDLIGCPWHERIAPAEHRRLAGQYMARMRGEPAPRRYEVQGVARDGTVLWIELAVSIVVWEGREAALTLVVDVTERVNAERALRESEERFRTLVENAAVGVYRVGRDGRLLLVNPALAQMLGYDSVAQMTTEGILADHFAGKAVRAEWLAAMRATGMVRGMEIQWVRRDGAPLALRVSTVATRGSDGEIACYEGVVEDVTEQRRLLSQLAHAEKLSALGEMAAGMAHEINNPLAAVSATAELALRDATAPELRADLATIHREAGRAGEIVRSLLRFARHREPSIAPVAPDDIIQEAAALLAERARRHGVTLMVEQSAAGEVEVDRDQVLQVLLNLTGNAIDALKGCETREITMKAEEITDSVSITVSDTGPGVPEELRQRIFEPFVTTKPLGEGTGLGLSIAHRVATAHGGGLTLQSSPRGGATFRLTLPQSVRTGVEAAAGHGSAVVLHPDPMAAGLLIDGLRLIGFEPRLADGPDGPGEPEPALAVVAATIGGDDLAAIRALSPRRVVAVGGPLPDGSEDARLMEHFTLDELERAALGADTTEIAA